MQSKTKKSDQSHKMMLASVMATNEKSKTNMHQVSWISSCRQHMSIPRIYRVSVRASTPLLLRAKGSIVNIMKRESGEFNVFEVSL